MHKHLVLRSVQIAKDKDLGHTTEFRFRVHHIHRFDPGHIRSFQALSDFFEWPMVVVRNES